MPIKKNYYIFFNYYFILICSYLLSPLFALPIHSLEGTPVPPDAQVTPTFQHNLSSREDGNDTGLEHDDGAGQASNAAKSSKDAHPPTKKYRLTDKMKEII